jgi:L-rhamnono-1,4-lactonase
MQQAPTDEQAEMFWHWKTAMSRFAVYDNVYMKLSGSFSEMQSQNSKDGAKPRTVAELVEFLRPWVKHVFECFGPKRVMFGSDWPVCTVGGPGDDSWRHWRAVVEALLEDLNLTSEEQDRVWFGTAVEAYRLKDI